MKRFGAVTLHIVMGLVATACFAFRAEHKPLDLPSAFYVGEQKWSLSVSSFEYMLFSDKPLGFTNCKTHDIQIQNEMSDEDSRITLRVQLDHAITECETEHGASIEDLFMELSKDYEDLMADPRNAELRAFLENR